MMTAKIYPVTFEYRGFNVSIKTHFFFRFQHPIFSKYLMSMIDKDFEIHLERSLVIPSNYFERYACLYQQTGNAEKAWCAVEAELHSQTGGNRFLTLASFQSAQTRYHSGEKSRAVLIKIES